MLYSVLFVFLTTVIYPVITSESLDPSSSYPPCCSYPCQNQGICLSGDDNSSYSCDCTYTGYTGVQCERPTWYTWLVKMIKPSKATLHHILTDWKWKPLLTIINNLEMIHDRIIARNYLERANFLDSYSRYDSNHDYINFDAPINKTLHGRILPPVPSTCPTPLGVAGKKQMPPIESILPLFERKAFKPEPLRTNNLFPFYAQFFTHQFCRINYKLGPQYTEAWAHGIDLTQLYGNDQGTQRTLRTLVDGKMKVQEINGELWPPYVKDANVKMLSIPGISIPPEKQFALGHPFFSIMPGLFMYNTIWLREHNRVAAILKSIHSTWDDERLFQTTRLILIGELIKITVEDYVQHLSNYNIKLKFKPELLHGKPFQYQNKVSAEFNLMYRWHALIPDYFLIGGVNYTLADFIGRSDIVVKHGMKTFVEGLIKTRAGEVTHGNHNSMVIDVMRKTIQYGRDLRFQSFNNYRRHFGLPAYTSFEEMVGEENVEVVETLKSLYGDIEAVEVVPGFYLEKRRSQGMFGELIVELGAPASITGLMSNVIGSPKFWKPSTFGGEIGFNIVKTATLEKLFCGNMRSDKPCSHIGFKVPDDVATHSDEPNKEL